MIRTVAAHFHAKQPHSTVTLTMGAHNLSGPSHPGYLDCYPIPGLAAASDGIFIMSYVRLLVFPWIAVSAHLDRQPASVAPKDIPPTYSRRNSLAWLLPSFARCRRICGTTTKSVRAPTRL